MDLRPLPAFGDNYIWTLRDAGGRAVIVDPGDAGPVLVAADAGLQPAGVLLTHHHDDHIGGVAGLLARWPSLPVFAPFDDRIALATDRVADGDPVRIDDWSFDTLAVPGHTRSHVAFHGHGLLFCGDCLFSLGCGRIFEGTPAQMLASLDRLAALPESTRLCCGHEYTLGNATFACTVDPDNPALRSRADEVARLRDAREPSLPVALAVERATNPFLRVDAPEIRAAVERHASAGLDDRIATFAELRRWKDGFRA